MKNSEKRKIKNLRILTSTWCEFINNSEFEEKNSNQRHLSCCCKALTVRRYTNTDLFSLFFHLLFLCFNPFPSSLRFSLFILLYIHTPLKSKGQISIREMPYTPNPGSTCSAMYCDQHVTNRCTERKPRPRNISHKQQEQRLFNLSVGQYVMNKWKCDLVSSTFQMRKRVKHRNSQFADVLAGIVIRVKS